MTPNLSVQNLTVSYGVHVALNDVSLEIDAGELVALLGPNGAGKTSFVKALCRRVPIDSGHLSISGESLSRGKSRQNLIGLVPQDIGLYGHMTARENLMAFARIMGLPRTNRLTSVNAALERVGLLKRANMRVSALSGGMKRRINVAAAIMHRPKLLILDEPTAGADIPARDSIHALARELAHSGLSVLLVTHELEDIEGLCDKISILSGGCRLAFDTPENVLSMCYGKTRQVRVCFAAPPSESISPKLKQIGLKPTDLPHQWTTSVDSHITEHAGTLMNALGKLQCNVRDIHVTRPGLPALIRHVEKTGTLPC